MATKPTKKRESPVSWRPRPGDVDAMQALSAKLGISTANVLRLGLHRLAEFEGVNSRNQAKKENLRRNRAVSSAG